MVTEHNWCLKCYFVLAAVVVVGVVVLLVFNVVKLPPWVSLHQPILKLNNNNVYKNVAKC